MNVLLCAISQNAMKNTIHQQKQEQWKSSKYDKNTMGLKTIMAKAGPTRSGHQFITRLTYGDKHTIYTLTSTGRFGRAPGGT